MSLLKLLLFVVFLNYVYKVPGCACEAPPAYYVFHTRLVDALMCCMSSWLLGLLVVGLLLLPLFCKY